MHGVSEKLFAMLIGFIAALALAVFPLGGGVTTTRLALALLVFLLLINLRLISERIYRNTLMPIMATTIGFITSFISFVLHDGEIWVVVNWLFLGALCSLLAISFSLFKKSDSTYFAVVLVLSLFVIVALTVIAMKNEGALFSTGTQARKFLRRTDGVDLNGFMNTMFLNFSICAGILYFTLFRSIMLRSICLISLLASLLVIILSGSRQNLMACFVFIVLILFISSSKSNKNNIFISMLLNIRRLSLILLALLSGMVIAINRRLIDIEWIQSRFFSIVVESGLNKSDESRLDTALYAIECSLRNSGFGIGPGNYPPPEWNIGAHNGYLKFLADNGILPGGIALVLILGVISYSLFKCKKTHTSLAIIVWALFLIFSLLLGNVKDLFQVPGFWAIIGMVIGLSNQKNTMFSTHEPKGILSRPADRRTINTR